MHGLSIGKLAKAAKVSIHTIRFYEKSGVLPQPIRRPSGFREYSEVDVLQLQFVREARLLGFSLEEISELLALEEETSSAVVRAVVGRNLKAIDQRIARLQQWRHAFRELCEPPSGDRTKRHFLLPFLEGDFKDVGAKTVAGDSQQALRDSHDEG
jgi:MerR family transcriptional regulator, copper efflux regulator